jgi:molybdenum cofactor cytidylyltransferase
VNILSVLLAAGGGTRYRASLDSAPNANVPNANVPNASLATTHKLLALGPDGRSVVEHSFAAMATGSSGARLVVVSGAVELPSLAGATVLHNPRWSDGQSTSLWVAVDFAQSLDCEAIVVGLADQPGIGAAAWTRLRVAMTNGATIAVGTYGGQRRNPVGLARSIWPLLPTNADEGARSIMRAHPDLVTEVPCTGNSEDIDSVEDLLQWHLS